jgi:hypothetical protein
VLRVRRGYDNAVSDAGADHRFADGHVETHCRPD